MGKRGRSALSGLQCAFCGNAQGRGKNLRLTHHLLKPHKWQSLNSRGCHPPTQAQVHHLPSRRHDIAPPSWGEGETRRRLQHIFRVICSTPPRSRLTAPRDELSSSRPDRHSGPSLELCSCSPQTHGPRSSLCQTEAGQALSLKLTHTQDLPRIQGLLIFPLSYTS